MSNLETQDFVALRTSITSHRSYCLVELAERNTRDIFHEKFSKINIIALSNLLILRILSLIKNFSEDKPFIIPVIVMAALY